MSGDEVRLRLSACRWMKEDRDDPFFAEALAQAAREPDLALWWADQRVLDEALAHRLGELPIPPAFRPVLSGDAGEYLPPLEAPLAT